MRIWPKDTPRHTKSEAEKKVYEALKTGMPSSWQAWHSLKLRTRKRGTFSEADFIIADPGRPSVLILEVKGGQIEQRDGQWYQNNRHLERSPLDQAFKFRGQLIKRFRENNAEPPTIGVAACFPDTFFSKQPIQDNLRDLVIGGQDLPYLDKILDDAMAQAVPDPWPVKGPWIKRLHDLWGETWVPELRLGERIQLDREYRVQLDEEQLRKLDEIEENDSVLIRGAAGTGKTLLACEAAMRDADRSRRVLLVCFTDAPAKWLGERITHPDITIRAIRQFAVELLGEEAPKSPAVDPSEYWESVSLRAALDGLPPDKDRWDSVIVDEGQDFGEEDWELVQECVKEDGRLWVFADEAQAFWSDREIPERIGQKSFRVRLSRPYRCPPAIQNLSECYAGQCGPDVDLLKHGVGDKVIRVIPSSEQRLAKQIGKEVNRLLGEGLKPYEIVVISVRGRGAKEGIIYQEELGGKRIVPSTDPQAGSEIICDTFLRFKGLERPAVIVTDLRLVSDLYETRMHIAVSRATSLLRIVGVEAEIRQDQRLAVLI